MKKFISNGRIVSIIVLIMGILGLFLYTKIDSVSMASANKEAITELSLKKFINYKEEWGTGTLLHYNLKTGIKYSKEEQKTPIQSANIIIQSPQINNNYPESVIVATKSTKATNSDRVDNVKYSYDKNSGTLVIVTSNIDENGNPISDLINENEKDEFEIISNYGENAYNDENKEIVLELNISTEYKLLSSEDNSSIETNKEFRAVATENIGEIVSVENTTDDIYNGYLKSNVINGTDYVTSYFEKAELQIENKNAQDIITLNETGKNSIYKVVEVNISDMKSVLGEDGYIEIFDKENNLLATLNKEKTTYGYEGEIDQLSIRTSKIIKEGIIRINSIKEIRKDVGIVDNANILSKIIATKDENTTYEKDNNYNVEIKEAQTEVELQLNEKEWTNEKQNELTFDLSLNSKSSRYNLYKNPQIRIELPEEVEKVILGESTYIYGNGLELKEARTEQNENGRYEIIANLAGEQKQYNENDLGLTTNIKIPAIVILKKNIESKTSNLVIKAKNEYGIEHITTKEETIDLINFKEEKINLINEAAQPQLFTSVRSGGEQNNNLELEVVPTKGETVLSENDIVYEGEFIKYNIKVTNTSDQDMDNVKLVAAIPDGVTYGELEAEFTFGGNYKYNFEPETREKQINIGNIKAREEKNLFFETQVNDLSDSEESEDINTSVKLLIDEQEAIIKDSILVAKQAEVKSFMGTYLYQSGANDWIYEIKMDSDTSRNYNAKIHFPKEYNLRLAIGSAGENNSDTVNLDALETLDLQPDENGIINTTLSSDKTYTFQGSFNTANMEKYDDGTPVERIAYVELTGDNATYLSNENRVEVPYEQVNITISSETAGESIQIGDEINYEITVTNVGKVVKLENEIDAVDINVTDFLPEEVRPISVTYSNWTKQVDDSNMITGLVKEENITKELFESATDGEGNKLPNINLNLTIKNGESITIFVKTVARSVDQNTTISNRATVSGSGINTNVTDIISHTILAKEIEAPVIVPDEPDEPDGPETNTEVIDDGENTENIIYYDDSDNPDNPDNPSNPDNPESPSNPDNPDNQDKQGNEDNTDNQDAQNNYIISGITWLDENADGQRQTAEQTLSNMTVSLINLDNSGAIQENTTTSDNGYYSFSNLTSGKYLVLFRYDTNLYRLTEYQKSNSNSQVNSDAYEQTITLNGENQTVGLTDTIELNENAANIDAGFVKKQKSDFKVEKYISKVIVKTNKGTKEYSYDNANLAKVEIRAKEIEGALVTIEYKIVITNIGETKGKVTEIVDTMSKELNFATDLNSSWIRNSNGQYVNSSIANQTIEAGDSINLKIIATKQMTGNSTGTFTNNVEINGITNEEVSGDLDETNNSAKADIIISVSTGAVVYIVIIISLLTLLLIIYAILSIIGVVNFKGPDITSFIAIFTLAFVSISFIGNADASTLDDSVSNFVNSNGLGTVEVHWIETYYTDGYVENRGNHIPDKVYEEEHGAATGAGFSWKGGSLSGNARCINPTLAAYGKYYYYDHETIWVDYYNQDVDYNGWYYNWNDKPVYYNYNRYQIVENSESYVKEDEPTLSFTNTNENSAVQMQMLDSNYCLYGPFTYTFNNNKNATPTFTVTVKNGNTTISGETISICDASGNNKSLASGTQTFYLKIPKDKCTNGITSVKVNSSYSCSIETKRYVDVQLIFNCGIDSCQEIKTEDKWKVLVGTETGTKNLTASAEWKTINGIVEVEKVDKDNNSTKLSGVDIKLTKQGTTTSYTKTTGSDGKVTFNNISPANYRIDETKLPSQYGYTKAFTQINKTVGNGQLVQIKAENEKQFATLIIRKRDYDNVSNTMNGVQFRIWHRKSTNEDYQYIQINGTKTIDGSSDINVTSMKYVSEVKDATVITTGGNRQIKLLNMLTGYYRIAEVTVGNNYGYLDINTKYIFWNKDENDTKTCVYQGLNENGKINNVWPVTGEIAEGATSTIYVYNQKQTGRLKITKKDYNSGNTMAGIQFRLKQGDNYIRLNNNATLTGENTISSQTTTTESNATILKTNDSGLIDLRNIKVGSYTVEEVESSLPHGYNKSNIYWSTTSGTNNATKALSKTITVGRQESNKPNEKITTLFVYNQKQTGSLIINKTDIDKTSSANLTGVQFRLKQGNNYIRLNNKATLTGANTITSQKATNANDATKLITDSKGQIKLIDIIAGDYEIEEIDIGESNKNSGYTPAGNKTSIDYNYVYNENTVVGYNSNGTHKTISKTVTLQKSTEVTTKSDTINIKNRRKYVKLSGNVWEDSRNGKDNECNDLFDNDKDIKIQGIKVTLKDDNGIVSKPVNESTFTNPTYTDKNGHYQFNDVLINNLNNYYVEFEYDGQIYTTVKDYKERGENLNTNGIGTRSKAKEVNRAALDNKYESISGTTSESQSNVESSNFKVNYNLTKADKSIASAKTNNIKTFDGQLNGLTRNVNGFKDQNNKNKEYENYTINKITANTKDTDYKVLGNNTINNIRKNGTLELTGINCGLREREKLNLSIYTDLVKVTATVNGYTHDYNYSLYSTVDNMSEEDEATFKLKVYNGDIGYTRKVYPSDIKNGCEIYLTYRITVKNHSNTLSAKVYKVANYYDTRYTIEGIGKTIDCDNKDLKLDENTVTANGYTKTYLEYKNDAPLLTSNSRSTEIYVKYKLTNEAVLSIMDKHPTFYNVVEIQQYASFYGDNTFCHADKGDTYTGIDRNSAPGNIGNITKGEKSTTDDPKPNWEKFEDDTAFAPAITMELTTSERTITGNVFEDMKESGGSLGNGIFDKNKDRVVEGVKVEIVDFETKKPIYVNETGVYVDENTQGAKILGTTSAQDGSYTISGIIPGKYLIKYTYGNNAIYKDGTEVVNSLNADNYKSTIITSDVIKRELTKNPQEPSIWYKEIDKPYSCAIDDEESFNRGVFENEKTVNKNNQKTENGDPKTAYSAGLNVRFELIDDDGDGKADVTNSQSTNTVSKIKTNSDGSQQVETVLLYYNENICFGIIERPKRDYEIKKEITDVKLSTAQQPSIITFETDLNEYPFTRADTKKLEADSDILVGATVEVTYKVTAMNNSEEDYNTENYYYYGVHNDTDKECSTIKFSKVIDYLDNELVYDKPTDNMSANNSIKVGVVTGNSINLGGETLNMNDYLYDDVIERAKKHNNILILENGDAVARESETVWEYKASQLVSPKDEISYVSDVECIEVKVLGPLTVKNTLGNFTPDSDVTDNVDVKYQGETDYYSTPLSITPPTGENRNVIIYVISGISLVVLAAGIWIIKKKIL